MATKKPAKPAHKHEDMGFSSDTVLTDGTVDMSQHNCSSCSHLYQSPIILPLDKVKEPPSPELYAMIQEHVQTNGPVSETIEKVVVTGNSSLMARLPLATPTKFYLSQQEPKEFEEMVGKVLGRIAKDKNLLNTLTSKLVVGDLNADLVEHFLNERKIEKDPEHRAFEFFAGFRKLFGHKAHEDSSFDKLSDRKENLGLVSRYLRKMLGNPHCLSDPKCGEARKEIFSYLLPSMLAILDDKEFLEPVQKDHPAQLSSVVDARDKLTAIILDALGEQKINDIINPDTFKVQVIDAASGSVSVTAKEMGAENYKGTSVDVKIKDPATGNSIGKIRYLGAEWELQGIHFHTAKPEHKFTETVKAAARFLKSGKSESAEYNGEAHLVFKKVGGNGYVVLGAPIQASREEDLPALKAALEYKEKPAENAPKQQGEPAATSDQAKPEATAEPKFSFTDFLPGGKIPDRNVTYLGGLTTTPYHAPGGVRFILSRNEPLEISPSQFKDLHSLIGASSSRPLQPGLGRLAFEVTTAKPQPQPQVG